MSKEATHENTHASPMNIPQKGAVLAAAQVSAIYLAGATIVSPYLSKPNGISQRFFLPFWLKTFSILRLGTPAKGKIPVALLMAGAAVTFIFTAGGSVSANAAGNTQGYNNREPRVRKRALTGLQGRIASTHDNLLEFFGGFAAAAILAAQYDNKGSFDNQLALVATLK